MRTLITSAAALALLVAVPQAQAQQIDFGKEKKAVVKHWRFAGDHREESMWSAL